MRPGVPGAVHPTNLLNGIAGCGYVRRTRPTGHLLTVTTLVECILLAQDNVNLAVGSRCQGITHPKYAAIVGDADPQVLVVAGWGDEEPSTLVRFSVAMQLFAVNCDKIRRVYHRGYGC